MKEWQNYEQVAANLARHLFEFVEHDTTLNLQHPPNNKWLGASGYAHQIDVSLEGPTDIILIECKHSLTRKVSVPAFLTFLARIIDITPKHPGKRIRGKIVTTKGFHSGVQKLASHYDIDLDLVHSLRDYAVRINDSEIVARNTDIGRGTERILITRHCGCSNPPVLSKDGQTLSCPRCFPEDFA